MYRRTEELKELLSQMPEFDNALYDDGILKDIRFKFVHQNETFVLLYKFDYSRPHLYHIKRDRILTEVKAFIIPKPIKRKIAEINNLLQTFHERYYPLIPGQRADVGLITYQSKYLNEYANSDKEITYLTTTYFIYQQKKLVNEVEFVFAKKSGRWVTEKTILEQSMDINGLSRNVSLFERELLNALNRIREESPDALLLKAAQTFLEETN